MMKTNFIYLFLLAIIFFTNNDCGRKKNKIINKKKASTASVSKVSNVVVKNKKKKDPTQPVLPPKSITNNEDDLDEDDYDDSDFDDDEDYEDYEEGNEIVQAKNNAAIDVKDQKAFNTIINNEFSVSKKTSIAAQINEFVKKQKAELYDDDTSELLNDVSALMILSGLGGITTQFIRTAYQKYKDPKFHNALVRLTILKNNNKNIDAKLTLKNDEEDKEKQKDPLVSELLNFNLPNPNIKNFRDIKNYFETIKNKIEKLQKDFQTLEDKNFQMNNSLINLKETLDENSELVNKLTDASQYLFDTNITGKETEEEFKEKIAQLIEEYTLITKEHIIYDKKNTIQKQIQTIMDKKLKIIIERMMKEDIFAAFTNENESVNAEMYSDEIRKLIEYIPEEKERNNFEKKLDEANIKFKEYNDSLYEDAEEEEEEEKEKKKQKDTKRNDTTKIDIHLHQNFTEKVLK